MKILLEVNFPTWLSAIVLSYFVINVVLRIYRIWVKGKLRREIEE
jgi:antibiotic biosynthesis monooxygenase (ABM) superfamily enzyme